MIDALPPDARARVQLVGDELAAENPDRYGFEIIESEDGKLWAIPEESRYWGDCGECLGADAETAIAALNSIY